jgi:hypothetical protein
MRKTMVREIDYYIEGTRVVIEADYIEADHGFIHDNGV